MCLLLLLLAMASGTAHADGVRALCTHIGCIAFIGSAKSQPVFMQGRPKIIEIYECKEQQTFTEHNGIMRKPNKRTIVCEIIWMISI